MSKYYGTIGFGEDVETRPGIHKMEWTEKKYQGDVIENARRVTASSESTNDDLTVSNQISILADPYAYKNFHLMRYATYMGVKWRIINVRVLYPRLILTLGGEYHADNGEYPSIP